MRERPLRIVIVGHVDHGKSTLVGRLFHDTGSLPEGKFEYIQATCKRRGVPFEWAFLMDALQAERDQNITIDTAQIWFRTEQRPYVIIDAPGHREFLKNMITGAASAHAALLLIAADEGVREQSRRHGYMLSMLGIDQVAVVVNKMDLVGYSQQAFETIEREYREFLGEIGIDAKMFIPISAREGDQIASRAEAMPWFQGRTVVEALDDFEMPTPTVNAPVRLPLQDIYRFDHRRILSGRMETGEVRVGDELAFYPGGKTSKIASIERWSAPRQDSAKAGESIGVILEEQIFVDRGHVATKVGDAPPTVTDRFRANVFWMGRNPLEQGKGYRLKLATQEVDVHVEQIETVLDASSLTTTHDATSMNKDDVAQVVLRTREPVALDLPQDIVATGRFVLVDVYDVAGGGIVTETLAPTERELEASERAVTARVRFRRQGHLGAVVAITGDLDAASLEVRAHALDRVLLERGLRGYVLRDVGERAEILSHLAHAGVIAIAPGLMLEDALVARIEDLGAFVHVIEATGEGDLEQLAASVIERARVLGN
ncbi:MAG: GTP-binding protein [Myxococcota bacterium]